MRRIDESDHTPSDEAYSERFNIEKQERERRVELYAEQIDHARIAREERFTRPQRNGGEQSKP